ncbi:MAG: threonine/serine dehydratase [Parvularculaceae bacterium]
MATENVGDSAEKTISAAGVRRAAARLEGLAVRTPFIESDVLNETAGGRILLKPEVLQHCGSFKFRGAYNLIAQLTPEERARGVLAWSSGNHGQGVARAARHFNTSAVIVMPTDAPQSKVEKVRGYGAEIIPYDRYSEDREAIGRALAEERRMALAPSYDHVAIIEGQGTVGLETAEDAATMGAELDAFIICCGGGGLTSGCATIFEEVSPDTEIWIAEPEGFDETWASIRDGETYSVDIAKRTICDALATPAPGALTLPIMRRLVKGGLSISEDEVARAIVYAFKYLKLVLEPGGAVALAAILTGKFDASGKTVALTLSGGNVDPPLFASILERFG